MYGDEGREAGSVDPYGREVAVPDLLCGRFGSTGTENSAGDAGGATRMSLASPSGNN
ncbi:hypothetical protein ACFYU5_03080 [Nocardia aobensis]|uniref:Uncharacterized protein n=1 Tax=Nocardia aobensis TaxID=257277 RepID=A0ABW6NWF3_9NOCA